MEELEIGFLLDSFEGVTLREQVVKEHVIRVDLVLRGALDRNRTSTYRRKFNISIKMIID